MVALKTVVMTLRLTPAVHRALETSARKGLRPVAQELLRRLVDQLRDEGLLSQQDAEDALVRAPRGDRGRKRAGRRRGEQDRGRRQSPHAQRRGGR